MSDIDMKPFETALSDESPSEDAVLIDRVAEAFGDFELIGPEAAASLGL